MSQDMHNDYPNNPHDQTGPGARAPGSPPTQPAGAEPASAHRGFTLQHGGRNAMTDTAERIGSAVGAAQRQLRHSLELVAPVAYRGASSSGDSGAGNTAASHTPEQEQDELAARRIQEIEEEVAEACNQACNQAAYALGQCSGAAEDCVQLLRDAVSNSRQLVRQLTGNCSLPTVAAIAGFCFAFGFTLCLGSSRRR